MKKFTFLIPVFNDWDSLNILLGRIDQEISLFEDIFEVVVVNDGSTIKRVIKNENYKKINIIKVLNLKKNLGSQRALAIGLKHLSILEKETNIILMDADGEDDPSLLKKIIDSSKKFPNKIITVNRTKRNESLIFRFMYEVHCLFTLLVTGKKVRFGNYSLINSNKLTKILACGDLWGAYSAAIVNNYTDIKPLFFERKKRETGKTKMNLFNLILHSLKIISVLKKRLYFASIIYILFFISTYFIYGNILFLLLIFLIILFNTLIFAISVNNREKYLNSYTKFIESVDTIK
jgi:hypothetical protein